MSMIRTRWAALGAAVAITLGGGGIGLVGATVSSGERPVLIPMTPCRVADTRADSQVGPKASPLGPNEIHTISVHGSQGDCTEIPSDALAVSLNVTALGATLPTFLTIWADGEPQPKASSLNPSPGQPPTPNAVTTELSPAGRFDVFNKQGNVDVIVDVNGYYVNHNHNDLYYTKSQSNDRYVLADPALTHVQPHMLDFHPGKDSDWRFVNGWSHSDTAAVRECLNAELLAPAGSKVTSLDVTYSAPANLQADVIVAGLLNTAGPASPGARVVYHLVDLDAALPSTTDFQTVTLLHEFGTPPVPVGADSDTLVVFCVDDPIKLISIRVNLA